MSRVDVTYSGNRNAADAQTLIFIGVTLSGAAVVIAMRTRSCAALPPPPLPLRHREFRVFQLRAAPLAPPPEGSIQKHSTFKSMQASRTPTDEMIAPSAPRFRQ